jgi:hypothetical protein
MELEKWDICCEQSELIIGELLTLGVSEGGLRLAIFKSECQHCGASEDIAVHLPEMTAREFESTGAGRKVMMYRLGDCYRVVDWNEECLDFGS